MKKTLSLLLAMAMLLGICSMAFAEEDAPIRITLLISDNPTFPFRNDWRSITYIEEKYNVDLEFEPVPLDDFDTKASSILTSQGNDTPDVVMGGDVSLGISGALYAFSDHPEWTPNFNARVAEFGLETQVEMCRQGDGRMYHLTGMSDTRTYDGGLILRQDYLEAKGFDAPETFDDLYRILKAYKEDYPDSLPLTTLLDVGFLLRMTMPSWGISLGFVNSTGTDVLSWDYENETYFAGAVSESYKDYVAFIHKLYAEGLLDPEMTQDIDVTSRKLTTGAAMAVYAYYDQIPGWEQASEIEGFKLNLYPPLAGPGGAHHQPGSTIGTTYGLIIPIKTAQREDFEQVVRKIDEVFFSREAALVWCLGVEGETYTMDGDRVVFADDILNAPEGVFKYMQVAYGCGNGETQYVTYNALEMAKFDENYAEINAKVAAMDRAIQYLPVSPAFDELTSEDAALMQTALADAFATWNDAFIRGTRGIEADWDAYVEEMKEKGIDEFLELYNQFNRYQ